MATMSGPVTVKRDCCGDLPRCRRCPVVYRRLAKQGLAVRVGKRTYEAENVGRKAMAAARGR
jgi:hypothetical protein